MTRTTTTAGSEMAGAPAGFVAFSVRPLTPAPADANEVLLEQLRYLIAYASHEQDRLERVKAILMETFQ